MRHGKLIGVLVILLVAVTFLGVVSAAEVTIGSEKFNIPDGYSEDTSQAKEKESSTGTTYVREYSDGKNKIIFNVNVFGGDITGVKLNEEPGYENKTIKGIEGMYNSDTHSFHYATDNATVFISATGEGIIEEFLIE